MSTTVVMFGHTSTTNLGGGDFETVQYGGLALSGTVASGGLLIDDGTASATAVLASGTLSVGAGGSGVGLTESGGPVVVSGGIYSNLALNGGTVTQQRDCTEVDYFHLEFAQYEVIWAEGALAESFVDDDSRALFHNASEFAALYSAESPRAASFYAPRISDGFELDAIRQRLPVQADCLAA